MPKFARRHVRLWSSALLGAASFFALPAQLPVITRVLIGWNVFTLLFLVLACQWMHGKTAKQIASRYEEEDESAPVILLIIIVAALLSLAAIVAQLAVLRHAGDTERLYRIGLAALTVMSSWLLVAMMFTLHYADLFYRGRSSAAEKPLAFPRTIAPTFADFAYFSFTIAAACQTSDVSTTQGPIRHVVLAQTIVSFIFNLAILGFAINVTAGLLGSH
jgi:uncharacterized membrane protein